MPGNIKGFRWSAAGHGSAGGCRIPARGRAGFTSASCNRQTTLLYLPVITFLSAFEMNSGYASFPIKIYFNPFPSPGFRPA